MLLYLFRGQNGPKGILLTYDGHPIPASRWRCQRVNDKDDAISRYSGWAMSNYDDSQWPAGKVNYIYIFTCMYLLR